MFPKIKIALPEVVEGDAVDLWQPSADMLGHFWSLVEGNYEFLSKEIIGLPKTQQEALSWIENRSQAKKHPLLSERVYSWFIYPHHTNQLSGCISLFKIDADTESSQGEISYWLGKEHTGQGIVTNALRALHSCTDRMKMKTILNIRHRNEASQKVASRLGYLTADNTTPDYCEYFRHASQSLNPSTLPHQRAVLA